MLYYNVQSNKLPDKVVIDKLPGGNKIVRLRDRIFQLNLVSDNNEDRIPEYTGYQYDEVVFPLPYDRDETVESIEEFFSDWWSYGENALMHETPPTLEQRVSDLEDMLLFSME